MEINLDQKKENPVSLNRPIKITILSLIVGISGVVLLLAVGFNLAGNSSLEFLLSGLGIFGGLPVVVAGLLIATLGIVLFGVSVGLWRLKRWALYVGLIVSAIQIMVSSLDLNFTSFIFIRGLILFAYLLAVRRYLQS